MARQWRIEYEGALYHVLSRGNEGRNIVIDNHDRTLFLEKLGRMCERYDVEVYAYVLMDNHYHLVLRTRRANLSRSMQWLGVTYTRHFNLRHERHGHLFQGRFKTFLIGDESYLLQLSYYIHRNPLRAGKVKRLIDYPWSSCPAYANGKNQPRWLNTELILSFFGGKDKHRSYRQALQAYAGEEKRIWEDVRHGLFMGTDEFIENLKTQYLSGRRPHREIPQQRRILRERNVANMVDQWAKILDCRREELVQRRRVRERDKESRDLLIYLLWERGVYTNSEIGQLFALSYSAVSRRVAALRASVEDNRKIREKLTELKSQIKM